MTYSTKLITTAIAGLLVMGAAACSDSKTSTPPAPTVGNASATPSAQVWGHGTYKVGEAFPIGTYKTPGDGTSECYWNRLSDDSGNSSAIIARNIFSGPDTFTVASTDAFIKLGGGCKWTRA